MLKQVLFAVLMIAVALMGVPTVGFAASALGKGMKAMENCDCPPGKSMIDMPCHQDGCPPSLDCFIHCSTVPPLATQVTPLRITAMTLPKPELFADTGGSLPSSTYPPYRPPQA